MRGAGLLAGVGLVDVGAVGVGLLAVCLLALGITGCAHRAPAGSSTIETGYWPHPDECLGVVGGKYVASVPCESSKETQ